MDELDAWLTLNASGVTPARQRALVEHLGTAAAVMAAEATELGMAPGLRDADIQRLRQARQVFQPAAVRAKMEALGVTAVPFTAAEYPSLLQEAPDPPALLFSQGSLTRRDEMAVAIVGTRHCTPYGSMVARRLAGDLARRGFTIVSGLALGIDAAAHEGALEAGGRTLAVMASGMDTTYPTAHRELRERIAGSGAVLTEQAFGVPPLAELFPTRNRIVAGLTLATVVVESPANKGGALITARLAAEAGREVGAVPGSVDCPVSHGPHQLIKEGARLIEVAEDVVESLGILLDAVPTERPRAEVVVSGDEATVCDALSYQPRHVDEVVAESGLPPAQVNAALMLLEIKGLVRRFPGSTYVRL